MSIIPTLYLSVDAGPAEGVAERLSAIIDGAFAEDFTPAELLGWGVVLVSGLRVDVWPIPAPGESFGLQEVRVEPDLDLVVRCGTTVACQVSHRWGGRSGREQDLDMLALVVALLEKVSGDAVLDYEGDLWLVRHEGRIILNDRHGLDAEQLALIPKPLHWATMDYI